MDVVIEFSEDIVTGIFYKSNLAIEDIAIDIFANEDITIDIYANGNCNQI